jgi:hypothetical protein
VRGLIDVQLESISARIPQALDFEQDASITIVVLTALFGHGLVGSSHGFPQSTSPGKRGKGFLSKHNHLNCRPETDCGLSCPLSSSWKTAMSSMPRYDCLFGNRGQRLAITKQAESVLSLRSLPAIADSI